MRSAHLVSTLTIVGLTVLSTTAAALEPTLALSRAFHPIDGTADAAGHSGSLTVSDACPAISVGVLSDGSTILGSTTGSSDDFVAGCGSNAGGQDQIFEFAVDLPGVWSLDTCTVPACFDTTLEIRQETGDGCPGYFRDCDADGCPVCYYDSLVQYYLIPAFTYYLIVDGWSTFASGDFTVTATLVEPGCTDDAGCDDGVFCNGAETCDIAIGRCYRGSHPCTTYEGYLAPCDDVLGACVKPDDCFTWQADTVGSGYFFPQSKICPDTATWVFDDIQTSHHTTGVLDYYTTPIVARSTPNGASPLGTVFMVNQALFRTTPGSCIPEAQIAGTQCTGDATVDPSGSPPHNLPCSGTMPTLPNNSGDFRRCEIDFWMAFRTSENGAGMGVPGNKPELGGPAGADDFGVSVVALEDCPPSGDYSYIIYSEDIFIDFEDAVVCQKPGGSCCKPDRSCSLTSEADCAAFGGTFGFSGTINGTDGGCGGDPDLDEIYNRCGDNCEDDANPGQEDCDGDGFGDACDPEGDTDGDVDGHCDGVDNCPFIPNPGQENCDGDGAGDACDACPCDANDDADGDGVCGDIDVCEGHDDNLDDDGDGVPDGCDQCPDSDDGAAGALGDADGDGVPNCSDKCNGVDDTLFAPECEGAIPTTSQWGLIVLTLLLLAGGKIHFGFRAKRVARS